MNNFTKDFHKKNPKALFRCEFDSLCVKNKEFLSSHFIPCLSMKIKKKERLAIQNCEKILLFNIWVGQSEVVWRAI